MREIVNFIKGKVPEKSLAYKILKTVYEISWKTFYPYGYMRNYIYFPIMAFLRVHHIGSSWKKYAKLEKLRNVHQGKRCFIIATGPSLRWEDLDKLKNEITFGVNTLYRGYGMSNFRPDYYVVADKDVFIDFDKTDFKLSELARKAFFLNDMIKRTDKKVIPLPVNYLDHWFNFGNQNYNYYKNLKFSDNIFWGMYDKWTVTISAIEIAIYMGCNEIYLIGVDCNYSLKTLHFTKIKNGYEDWKIGKNSDVTATAQLSMVIGYEFMNHEARKRGVKIYNATRGGSLEVFERRDFDDIT